MPDPQPQPEEENDDIHVTGARFLGDPTVKPSGWFIHMATYLPPSFLNLFEEDGGEEAPRVATFEMIDGKVVFRLPGLNLRLAVPAADWANMSPEQRGVLTKMLNEFQESPMLAASLQRLESLGVQEIPIRFDSVIHQASGGTLAWGPAHYERMSMSFDRMPDGSLTNVKVVLNINSNLVPGPDNVHDTWTNTQTPAESVNIDFALMFLHAMRHAFYIGQPGMEDQVRQDADRMYDEIMNTIGSSERSVGDYTSGQTFQGSLYGDNATGTNASDTLSGLSGNDILNGSGGDDLVIGGAGMDRLSGGTGSNLVMGGLDADTYAPAPGVQQELISDTGGVDRLDLSRFTTSQLSFTRYDDTLVISTTGPAPETIEVQGQWTSSGRVEQFTFANGTFAASYVEDLATGGGAVCELCDPFTVTVCEHYAMPVVLDLDGDGIELIPVEHSRARFDIAGDGRWEHIGWVGKDDGILSLDRNGNGRIDDFSEISFVGDFLGAATDLEGLYAYDSNGDGFLTAADARFSDFLVWKDGNGNGHSERGELFTLDALGIVSIGLERRDVRQLDTGAEANQILATSTFQTAGGTTHLVGDVALEARLHHQGNAGSTGLELLHLNAEAIII